MSKTGAFLLINTKAQARRVPVSCEDGHITAELIDDRATSSCPIIDAPEHRVTMSSASHEAMRVRQPWQSSVRSSKPLRAEQQLPHARE